MDGDIQALIKKHQEELTQLLEAKTKPTVQQQLPKVQAKITKPCKFPLFKFKIQQNTIQPVLRKLPIVAKQAFSNCKTDFQWPTE